MASNIRKTLRSISTTPLTTSHMLLITRIRKEMIKDEIDNLPYRFPYDKKWVEKFLERIVIRGKYSPEEKNILMEFRNSFLTELKLYESW